MTALLTDNLSLLAGAPNGIKKLRELILELAVRGKLVPQDPNDEPASELLKRIAEEKARLVVAGKKVKQQADINDKEQPFSVPQGWGWVRLGSCLEMINGRAFKPSEWIAAGLPIVRIQNLNKADAPFNYCDPDTVDDRHVIDTGTILISWSGTPGTSFGAFIWERGKAALNQHIFSCSQVGDAFFDKFLKLAINARLEELIAKAHGGVGLQHVTKGKLEALTLVLPPLAEQHRIVAKVDELMVLCDRLEARQADAESAHAQLVQTLLDSLTRAGDAEDFAQSWRRLAEHFHILFTTQSSIDSLKQTLLQLAVMGKLVPQKPHDEPASELLKQIDRERNQLVSQKVIRKGKLLPDIEEHEMQFKLPVGWEWVRLGQIGDWGAGATPARGNSNYYGGEMPWFKSGELVADLISDSEEKVTELALKECSLRRNKSGDVLIAMYGATIGKAAILSVEGTTNQAVCACTPFNGVFNRYLLLTIKALRSNFLWQGAGGAQPNISREKIIATVTGLPPSLEQHRIVAKVDQLMTLCDQLKARLSQARQMHGQLANALVEQAVA